MQDFKPTPAELNYPPILVSYFEKVRQKRSAAADVTSPSNATADDVSIYDTWFPTLQRTLLCLSKMYRCVEVRSQVLTLRNPL